MPEEDPLNRSPMPPKHMSQFKSLLNLVDFHFEDLSVLEREGEKFVGRSSLPFPPLSPIPASTSSPPLLLSSTNRREDRPEVTLPPQKRLGITLGPRYKVRESSSAAARPAGGLRADYGFVATIDREIRRNLERYVGYGITDYWDEIVKAMHGTPVVTDVAEFSHRMTAFETRVRQD
ncbi:hypothetical protein Tco_0204183 [Tanacetum coccineum]